MRAFWLTACVGVLCLAPSIMRADEKKEEPKGDAKTYQVPYKLTEMKHVLIRAKINGKGPYNFILDTGAPALFVSTALCKKLGVEPDKDGWGTFDKFDIEGGLSIPKAKGRIDDPFQIEGMNGLGLEGVELHGVIGYNILARYKLEFDFTKDKMAWTPLDFEPAAPKGLGGKGSTADMDAMAAMVKLATMFLGKREMPEPVGRGFLGIETKEGKDSVEISAVLAGSPAAKAGVKPGDQITQIKGKAVKTHADVQKRTAELKPGDSITLTVVRSGEDHEITIKAGEGL